jgi:hypothetical protein
VVVSGQPLIVPDARADDRLHTDPAIAALGVIPYAGMPLTDADELVLGSLCALAHKPRPWTDEEQGDLTAACSAELRLRILSAQRRSTQKVLETARTTAEQTRSDAKRLEHEAQAGLDHAELLLRALGGTGSDLRPRGCPSAAAGSVQRRRQARVRGSAGRRQARTAPDPPPGHRVLGGTGNPLPARGRCVPERPGLLRRPHGVADRQALVAGYSPEAVGVFDHMGFSTVLCLPLWGSRTLLGVLTICWIKPHEVSITERATLTAASGYIAQAVERALYLDERISVARQLQEAMLTDLPLADHVEISALYQPSANDNMIGGD